MSRFRHPGVYVSEGDESLREAGALDGRVLIGATFGGLRFDVRKNAPPGVAAGATAVSRFRHPSVYVSEGDESLRKAVALGGRAGQIPWPIITPDP